MLQVRAVCMWVCVVSECADALGMPWIGCGDRIWMAMCHSGMYKCYQSVQDCAVCLCSFWLMGSCKFRCQYPFCCTIYPGSACSMMVDGSGLKCAPWERLLRSPSLQFFTAAVCMLTLVSLAIVLSVAVGFADVGESMCSCVHVQQRVYWAWSRSVPCFGCCLRSTAPTAIACRTSSMHRGLLGRAQVCFEGSRHASGTALSCLAVALPACWPACLLACLLASWHCANDCLELGSFQQATTCVLVVMHGFETL